MTEEHKDTENAEENLLDEIFGNEKPLWKDKYKLDYCSLCDTAIICCSDCKGTSCNCQACEKCSADGTEFNEQCKTSVYDYLSEDEIKTYEKSKRLKHFIMESLKMGDKEINWEKMNLHGHLCQIDIEIFGLEHLPPYDHDKNPDVINRKV